MHIPPWPQAGERELELLRQVLGSPQWGGFHPFVEEFESSFAAYQHSRFGIAAFNGTVTLEALLSVLDIGPGDEVIVPAISFVSTATAVSRIGAIPVFVDIDGDTFNLDPERVRQSIGPRTRAIFAVHFGGTMCDLPALEALCREHNLVLLEDAAHAQGSELGGRRAGSFGLAGSFSFQNGKVLSSGEGGILTASDPDLAARLRSFVNCGRVPGRSFYDHVNLGSNLRMTAFQAAVLLAQLEQLPQQIAQRTTNAHALRIATADLIQWQREPEGTTQNSFYLLTGRLPDRAQREALCQALAAAGVPVTPFYPHTLYQNELYRNAPCRVTPCPVAEQCVEDSFWLPHRVLLSERRVIDEIANVMRTALATYPSFAARQS
ncbi:MAG TPA: DegT/DnrJ/EryC1/StrS family aminotransferase [Bryobacteraceae bacterium]|jgi:dTDP-4-amino-4,6-dideoxygalactose transaminase|nr:DegT/DnrJ/EryC1/StrS family aminotransferase [Bryobacteraceae bacterium]